MPVAVQALQRGLQGLIQYLTNRKTQHQLADAFASIDAVNNWLARSLTAILQVLAQVQGAWKFVQPRARNAGDSLDVIARDVDVSFKWFIATLIPHSLSWTIGYLEQHAIVPLQQRVTSVENQVKALVTFMARITTWRNTIVDPTIRDYRQLRSLFYSWPLQILQTWRSWFAKPSLFATWATPVVAQPLVKYYTELPHRPLLDTLVKAGVDATPDVYKDVIGAFERILDLPYG